LEDVGTGRPSCSKRDLASLIMLRYRRTTILELAERQSDFATLTKKARRIYRSLPVRLSLRFRPERSALAMFDTFPLAGLTFELLFKGMSLRKGSACALKLLLSS